MFGIKIVCSGMTTQFYYVIINLIIDLDGLNHVNRKIISTVNVDRMVEMRDAVTKKIQFRDICV
jgi:hypothetical protein